jgi:hypothetical protein
MERKTDKLGKTAKKASFEVIIKKILYVCRKKYVFSTFLYLRDKKKTIEIIVLMCCCIIVSEILFS